MDTYIHEGPLIAVGNGGSANFHYAEKFNASTHTLVYDCKETANKKYVYYMLKYNSDHINESCFKGTGLKNLKLDDFNEFAIPLPPLETQQEIVAELDSIYDNAHKASQMATSIKTQMASIMKSVGMRGYEQKKISEACDISKGKRCLDGKDTGYPYQDVSHVSRLVDKYILDGPAVLTPRAMSIGRFVYTTEKCHPSDDMFILKSKVGLNPQFLYYYSILLLVSEIKKAIHGVKPTIDYSAFDMLYIYIPPLETQHQILTILNEMEGERKSLEQMASKAEERAKFILDGFLN
jgi:restriction endonuclease S subunit